MLFGQAEKTKKGSLINDRTKFKTRTPTISGSPMNWRQMFDLTDKVYTNIDYLPLAGDQKLGIIK